MVRKTKKITLELTENQYIDLVEAIDMAISTIIHRGCLLFKYEDNLLRDYQFKEKLIDTFVKEHDSYMTIRAMVTKQ